MKTIWISIAASSLLLVCTTASADWTYGLFVTNIDVQSNGTVFVNFQKPVSPICAIPNQTWVVFRNTQLTDKIIDRFITVLLSAYVSGKYVGVSTTGVCDAGTAQADRVQFTDYNP